MKWSVLLDFKAEITQRVPSWKDFLGYELEVVRNACRFACRICDDCDLPALTLCYNVLTNLRLPNLDAVGPWEAMPESTLAFTGEFNRSDGFEALPLYMRFNCFREPEVLECHMSEFFCAIGEMAVMLLAAGKINDVELDSCLSSALRALGDKKVAAAFAKASEKMKDREKAFWPQTGWWLLVAESKGNGESFQGVGDTIDEESPMEGVVVDWPEKALEKPAGDTLKQQKQKPRRAGKCCSRRCWALSTCCGLSMVASIICTPLLWPKDPEWKLVDLEIVNRDDMMFFVMAMAGMSAMNENTTIPPLNFAVTAEIHNPNLLGGVADPGCDFEVFWRGRALGTARSAACAAQPQSSAIVGANSTISLHYHLFQDLTAEVLANELKLSILVKGGAMVEGPMGIRIRVGLECTLHCAIEKLFDPDARHEVVQSKECQYSGEDEFRLHDMYRGWGQLHVEYSSAQSPLSEGDWPHEPFYDPKADPISRLSYWLELAEHFRFPHILHFASLPEMIHLVLHTSWAEVSVQTSGTSSMTTANPHRSAV
eukprot:Skav222467  [mRNA]  locus=scaffold2163:137847:151725:- [translate_table: standard]